MAPNVLWFEEMDPNMCFSLKKLRPIWSSWENIRTKSDPIIFRARWRKFGQKSFAPPKVCLLLHLCLLHPSLRLYILENINQGNLGIVRCRSRTSEAVWWLRLSLEVEEIVKKCFLCSKHMANRREPVVPSTRPARPWETAGSDLFEFDGKHYLVAVDYFSHKIEVGPLRSTMAATFNQSYQVYSIYFIASSYI